MVESLKNKYFIITVLFLFLLFLVGGLLTRNMEYYNYKNDATLSLM